MTRLGWGAVVVCGCGRVGFDAIAVRGDAGDAGGDAPPGMACVNASPSDTFAPGGQPCGTWGGATQRGLSLARTANGLVATLTTFMSNADYGGCTASNYDESQGAFVEVTSVLAQNTGYTNFTAYVTSSGSSAFGLQVDAGGMALGPSGNNRMPYVATAMRFWRIVPSGSELVAQYSADASTWTELGRQDAGTTDFTSIYNVTFGAGRSDATGAGTATFASFNVCP